MFIFGFIFKVERWKFNKDYGVWVSSEGRFKDRHKRILPVKINKNGYCCIKTERGYRLAHRLVLLTYCPTQDAENLTVDHLNHNKRDNSLKNLEWVTLKENLRRARNDLLAPSEEKEVERPRNKKSYNYTNVYINKKLFTCEEAINFILQLSNAPQKKRVQAVIKNVVKNKCCKTYCGLILEPVK